MAQVIAGDSTQSVTQSGINTPSLGKWFSKGVADPYRSVLVLRFALLNVLAFALLGAAYSQGYVHKVIEADQTYLSVVIFFVFLVGLVIAAQKIWQTSCELDAVNSKETTQHNGIAHLFSADPSRSAKTSENVSASMRMKLAHRISVVRHLGNTLVLLGLIGTVLGFIIALSGVNPEQAADVNSIAPMVSTLIQGMSTALYTTLIGSILNVWLMANYQLLSSGTVQLISSLLEASDKNA